MKIQIIIFPQPKSGSDDIEITITSEEGIIILEGDPNTEHIIITIDMKRQSHNTNNNTITDSQVQESTNTYFNKKGTKQKAETGTRRITGLEDREMFRRNIKAKKKVSPIY